MRLVAKSAARVPLDHRFPNLQRLGNLFRFEARIAGFDQLFAIFDKVVAPQHNSRMGSSRLIRPSPAGGSEDLLSRASARSSAHSAATGLLDVRESPNARQPLRITSTSGGRFSDYRLLTRIRGPAASCWVGASYIPYPGSRGIRPSWQSGARCLALRTRPRNVCAHI